MTGRPDDLRLEMIRIGRQEPKEVGVLAEVDDVGGLCPMARYEAGGRARRNIVGFQPPREVIRDARQATQLPQDR